MNEKTDITFAGPDGKTGIGLGLTLCQEFVERNRGKIWVESEVGKETMFKFTVPRTARNRRCQNEVLIAETPFLHSLA